MMQQCTYSSQVWLMIRYGYMLNSITKDPREAKKGGTRRVASL